jgi:hypothetical protein
VSSAVLGPVRDGRDADAPSHTTISVAWTRSHPRYVLNSCCGFSPFAEPLAAAPPPELRLIAQGDLIALVDCVLVARSGVFSVAH